METQTYFRCYFTNDMYKVGNVITEKEFNRVPTEYKGDFKPHKENKQQFCLVEQNKSCTFATSNYNIDIAK